MNPKIGGLWSFHSWEIPLGAQKPTDVHELSGSVWLSSGSREGKMQTQLRLASRRASKVGAVKTEWNSPWTGRIGQVVNFTNLNFQHGSW